MAAYEYLSPSDRLDIIHYIRTFTSFPEITDAQITSMNQQYNLTEGVVKANKIPINKAINLIVEENINDIKKIIDAKSRIDQKKNSEIGARLISTFTYDLNKVISSFMAANVISLDTYIKSVTESPISKGYKPAISQLNKAEWKAIYDLLKQLTI